MGKTSLVKKVKSQIDAEKGIKVVFMDIYKCRTAYDFYEKFASAVIQGTTSKMEKMIENTLSLGINPKVNTPEEILDLPERIARKRGIQIVVCIDEFQQIGEMPDSMTVQKTIRSVWQHHQHTSYCLFGSKQHMMTKLFYSRKMPFYQFGDMFFLKRIPSEKWVPFIVQRFQESGKQISEELALKICQTTDNYSAYVQQLAWNVFAMSDDVATELSFAEGLEATLAQVTPLFVEQTANLTAYQLNFIRAICQGYHEDFGKKEVTSSFDLGSRSNLSKLKSALVEREIVEQTETGFYIADPLFQRWFEREMA